MNVQDSTFIIMWSSGDVMEIYDITSHIISAKYTIWDILQDKKSRRQDLFSVMHPLIIKTLNDPQHSYEIYTITSDPDVDIQNWKQLWIKDHHKFKLKIRKHGQLLHSTSAVEAQDGN